MRFVVVSNLYPPHVRGGAEISTEILVRALLRLDHEVLVATLRTDNITPSPGLGVHAIRVRRPYDAFGDSQASKAQRLGWHMIELADGSAARELGAAARRFGAQAILSQSVTGIGAQVLPALARRLPGVPIVQTLRDYGLLCVRSTLYHDGHLDCGGAVGCRVRLNVSRRTTRAVAGVVGISGYVLDAHRERGLFRDVPAAVISNVVDPGASVTPAEERTDIGYLGRLSEEKGVLDLVSAYRAAHRSNPGLRPLRIAGAGTPDEVARVRSLSEGLPVELVGSVSSQQFLGEIGTLVVPSRWPEPFGRVVIEAGAAGCNLIVSDAGGLPEALDAALTGDASLDASTFRAGDRGALAALLAGAQRPAARRDSVPRRGGVDVASGYVELVERISR